MQYNCTKFILVFWFWSNLCTVNPEFLSMAQTPPQQLVYDILFTIIGVLLAAARLCWY